MSSDECNGERWLLQIRSVTNAFFFVFLMQEPAFRFINCSPSNPPPPRRVEHFEKSHVCERVVTTHASIKRMIYRLRFQQPQISVHRIHGSLIRTLTERQCNCVQSSYTTIWRASFACTIRAHIRTTPSHCSHSQDWHTVRGRRWSKPWIFIQSLQATSGRGGENNDLGKAKGRWWAIIANGQTYHGLKISEGRRIAKKPQTQYASPFP